MKILHITDTHGFHHQLNLNLEGVDVLVHTGDSTNHRNSFFNEKEFFDFLNWFSSLPVPNKIYVAGNHDSFIFENNEDARNQFYLHGIHYLNKNEVVIEGVKFYGDPIIPRFGDWCFMTDKGKLNKHWEMIPEDVNVLLTHTPPKGVLDLSEDRHYNLERCGCSALMKRVNKLKQLKLHCFGHIHNFQDIVNTGVLKRGEVLFSNATAVTDARFDLGITHNGNLIEI